MQKIIAIFLITLVSSNIIVENNLKLRKTAQIELTQILDEIKEYFEAGIKNFLDYCEKLMKYFEKSKIEKHLNKLINSLKDIKEKLKKYKFNELMKKCEEYIDKFINFILFLNPEILIDEIFNYLNKIREFFSITYFNEEIEKKIIIEIRRKIAEIDMEEIEKILHSSYFDILRNFEDFDINKFIKNLINFIEDVYREYSIDKFNRVFKHIKRDFYRKMEDILYDIHKEENNIREDIIKAKKELSEIEFNDELKQQFSEIFEKIQTYVNNLDNEKVLKVIKFFIETFIKKITTKNLDSYFKQIKSYIEKLKEYLYEDIYKTITEFYDTCITEIKQLTDKINPESIQNKIEELIKKIQDYLKTIDTVEFIKQVDKVFNHYLNYILKFDIQSPIHQLFQYIVNIREVINELGYDYIINAYNIIIDCANFLYESLPREYKRYSRYNYEIYGDGQYI